MIVFETYQIKKNDPVYPKSYANLKKLNSLTNWSPTLSIEEGIKKTVDWYLSNKEWWKTIVKNSLNQTPWKI